MLSFLSDFFKKSGIELFSVIPLKECKIQKPYLLEKAGIADGSAVIFAVPYLSKTAWAERNNISAYAVPKDYHGFFSEFYQKLLPELQNRFPEEKFASFSDHSPIDEISAALKTGLGILGKNHLLITKEYSSYIFLGEIVTTAHLDYQLCEVGFCENCGACTKACPAEDCGICLSALTQKKGCLNENEIQSLLKYQSIWGCDICQEVCPHTKKAIQTETIFTKIPYFNENLTPVLSEQLIENMSSEEFNSRAYAWRGKETILRNIRLLTQK